MIISSYQPERMRLATAKIMAISSDRPTHQELRENNMELDVSEHEEIRRKEECFTTLQSGHLL